MTYSVQQIKFEFLSYIKEFGSRAEDWHIGTCQHPDQTLFESGLIDRERDIWLWKPAMTPAAAGMVYRYFRGFGLKDPSPSEAGTGGPCVFLYRRADTLDEAGRAAQQRASATAS